MDFYWLDDKRHSYLHVGVLEHSIADIHSSKSGLSWRCDFELAGCWLAKNWHKGTREEVKQLVEATVQNFFDLANTSRPATDNDHD